MRYRKLTETGDYSFGNGSLDYISGVAAIAQAVKTRIMLFLAEWWEDQEEKLDRGPHPNSHFSNNPARPGLIPLSKHTFLLPAKSP